jgi:hypothetical protein
MSAETLPKNESLCFMIPVKIQIPKHEFYIRRCVKSIRRFYEKVSIIILLSDETNPIIFEDSNIFQIKNPYKFTLGCLYILDKFKCAEYAYIIHDSMIINRILPPPSKNVSFIYSFFEPGMMNNIYSESYKKILSYDDYTDLVTNHTEGCFGITMGIRCDIVTKIGVLDILTSVTTKEDGCAMERIFSFLCKKNNIEHDVLCGDIFGDTDPWAHPEFATMSLEEILNLNYPHYIIKAIINRQ